MPHKFVLEVFDKLYDADRFTFMEILEIYFRGFVKAIFVCLEFC